MTRLRLAAAALVLAAPILAAAPAAACSVSPGYRVPTNLELAASADLILLGTAEGQTDAEDEFLTREVIVRPIALLKGDALPENVRIGGYLSDDRRLVVASNPRELFNPNPGALTGGCRRYIFQRGMLLLLFLERDDQGRLHLASYPFARTAEDVPSPDAPWVRAVRFYVEIAALPEPERSAALAARREALRAGAGDPDAALLADDIDRQIRRRRIPPYD
jgi:hypothetical protein